MTPKYVYTISNCLFVPNTRGFGHDQILEVCAGGFALDPVSLEPCWGLGCKTTVNPTAVLEPCSGLGCETMVNLTAVLEPCWELGCKTMANLTAVLEPLLYTPIQMHISFLVLNRALDHFVHCTFALFDLTTTDNSASQASHTLYKKAGSATMERT